MLPLTHVAELIQADMGLAVVTTLRPDRSIAASVVNAGVLQHPVTGDPVVAFVSGGYARRLERLRNNDTITVVVRSGWKWVAIEGHADLVGPFDPLDGFSPDGLTDLLRDIYVTGGGQHEDWATYDEVMATERRTAVLVRPHRVYSNPTQSVTSTTATTS
jgi:hypothetical protein